MDTARWLRVRALLERALELDGAARADWLARECADDAELLREVTSLLASDSGVSALEPPDRASIARALGDASIGARVGPYVIAQRIGEGGMGAVYLAHRVDADFEQEVAIKLIKRGMDTEDILRQFHRERAVLSSLQHECIARLYDGGATEDGRPWFAMERIAGEPIDAWCAQHELTTRQRIALFLRVCSAVQHAHQRLIVHRDLKPSNMLVTADGTPKLLDFGIAKVLAGEAELQGNLTVAAERRLTPDYASPEQLNGDVVTTATDVYSLGVVLCELLAGAHPFRDASDPAAARATPAKPSTLARRALLTRAAPQHAVPRSVDADLDTIVLAALAPETARRYPSVDALAADLQRYLDGLPIHARPATVGYRLRKYVGRNRVAVATSAIVFVALALGLAAARAGYVEAVEQRNLAQEHATVAERESRRSAAVLGLTQRMFAAATPHDAKDKNYTLRQLLDDYAPTLDNESIRDPEVEASVRQTIGRAYQQIGSLDEAAKHLSRALELRRDNAGTSALDGFASRCDWIGLMHDRGAYVEAERLCAELVAEMEAAHGDELSLARVLYTRGELRDHVGRGADARTDLERAGELAHGHQPRDVELEILVLGALEKLSFAERDYESADRLMNEALELARAQFGARSTSVASLLGSLGGQLRMRNELDRADSALNEALAIQREVHGERDYRTGPMLADLGRVQFQRGNYREAIELLQRALEIARASLGPRHANVASDLSSLGGVLLRVGDFAAAEAAFRESLSIRTEVYGEQHDLTARALSNLSTALRQLGRFDEAETLLRRSLEVQRGLTGERSLQAGWGQAELAGLLSSQGKLVDAEAASREAVAILREQLAPDHVDLGTVLGTRASILTQLRRFDEALEAQREALRIFTAVRGPEHPAVANATAQLGWVLLTANQLDEARDVLTRALALHRAKPAETRATLPRTLLWRGSVAARQDERELAEDLLREALSANRALYGDQHMHSREAAQQLIKLLHERGADDDAEALSNELHIDASAVVE